MAYLTNTINREAQPFLLECALNFLTYEEYVEMFDVFCGIDEGRVTETYYKSLIKGQHPHDLPF